MARRFSKTIRLEPPTPEAIVVYEELGMTPPLAEPAHPAAAFWPRRPRWIHAIYALKNGYYWLPCVLCGRNHGGHEIGGSVPDPIMQHDQGGGEWGTTICPWCTAERNGKSIE
jgi:hypothetical protein